MSNAKVDKFVAMVEHARKIYREGEANGTSIASESKKMKTQTRIFCWLSNVKCNLWML
jgi:hypothetical protein